MTSEMDLLRSFVSARDELTTMDSSTAHHLLPQFLVISIALHLCVLLELNHPLLIAQKHHLGQLALDVRLEGNEPVPNQSRSLRASTGRPVAKQSGAHTLTSTETIPNPPSYSPAIDSELHTSASVSATKAELHNQLLGELKTLLSRYLTYPTLARRSGWEGTVVLSLRVEPDGQLDKIQLERSSGYAVLDDSAVNSLRQAGNLVEAHARMEGRSIDVLLPVIYKLIDN